MENAGIHYARHAFLLWWLLLTSSYANRRPRRQQRDSAIALQCYDDDVTNFSCLIGAALSSYFLRNARLGKSKRISRFTRVAEASLYRYRKSFFLLKPFVYGSSHSESVLDYGKVQPKKVKPHNYSSFIAASTYGRPKREVHNEREIPTLRLKCAWTGKRIH